MWLCNGTVVCYQENGMTSATNYIDNLLIATTGRPYFRQTTEECRNEKIVNASNGEK